MKKFILPIILFSTSLAFTQEPVTSPPVPPTPSTPPMATAPSTWVSISNEYISVAMDTTTGRYLIYDVEANYPTPDPSPITGKNFIPTISPVPSEFSNKSPILGKPDTAYNFATFRIDGNDIVFGSPQGSWSGSPIVTSTNIIYGWQLGDIEIIQTLSISTNIDTLFEDAISVTYDVRNNTDNKFFKVGSRITLDPSINEGLDVPFFLVDRRAIFREFHSPISTTPEYWLTADPTGAISPLSLKGFLRGANIITPDDFYITTMDRALTHPWNFRINRNNKLSGKDSAIIMTYRPKEIAPQSSITISAFQISRPSLLETFQNNGLEAKAGTFTTKNTSPMIVDVWLRNTSQEVFDDVDLTLTVPPWITVLDRQTKRVSDIGANAIPVSWKISSQEEIGRPADIKVQVNGLRNGVIVSQFEVPITVNLVPDFRENNAQQLQQTIAATISNVKAVPTRKSRNKQPTIITESFLNDDTYGSTIADLDRLYQELRMINNIDIQEIIKLLETERELLLEIQQTEQNLQFINNQYNILQGIYKQLYVDPESIDRTQVEIQSLQDSVDSLERQLNMQENKISNFQKRLDN